MAFQDSLVPSTPRLHRTSVSVEEIDYERRIRGERLKEASFQASSRIDEKKRANPAPPLIDEDFQTTKRRRLAPAYMCYSVDKENCITNSEDSSCFDLQPRQNASRVSPALEQSHLAIRSRWEEPVAFCNLKPRNLRLDLEVSAKSQKLETSMRSISMSDQLPYMPF